MPISGAAMGIARRADADRPSPRTVVSDEQIEAANRAALASLHKKVPEVKFDNTSFSDVIDFFRDITGANIAVNWRALESAGVDENRAGHSSDERCQL